MLCSDEIGPPTFGPVTGWGNTVATRGARRRNAAELYREAAALEKRVWRMRPGLLRSRYRGLALTPVQSRELAELRDDLLDVLAEALGVSSGETAAGDDLSRSCLALVAARAHQALAMLGDAAPRRAV